MNNVKVLKIFIVVALIEAIVAALFLFGWMFFRPAATVKVIEPVKVTEIKAQAEKIYSPNFEFISVTPDASDSSQLWLMSRNTARVMLINKDTGTVVDYTQQIPVIHDRFLTDLVRIGDKLFIGMQGGVVSYDLITRESKLLTEADGLISNANIRLNTDPADADVLWIGTFTGLSKLSIASGKVTNFSREMGIAGSQWEPRIFQVDNNYVWLTVGANALTTGGVARLDKRTNKWKSWGYEMFNKGRLPGRFDSEGAAADGEQAIAQDDGIIYSYDARGDKWLPLTKYVQTNYKKDFSLSGTIAHYNSITSGSVNSNQLKELNLISGVEKNLLDSAKEAEVKSKMGHEDLQYGSVKFDRQNKRLILYPDNIYPDSGIVLLNQEGKGSVEFFPFQNVSKVFPVYNMRLVAADENHIILSNFNSLVDYSRSSGTARPLLPRGIDAGKILDNSLVAINLSTCDMTCNYDTLVASSTVISLNSGKIESEAAIKATTTSAYYIGPTVKDIYLFGYDYIRSKQVLKLDANDNSFKTVDLQTLSPSVKPRLNDNREFGDVSPNGAFSFTAEKSQQGGRIKVSVKYGDNQKELYGNVGLERYSYQGNNHEIFLSDYSFDPSDHDVLWLGSNRGLVRLNVKTGESKLYDTSNGLWSDQITKIIATNGSVVIQQFNGIYSYQLQ